MASTYSNTKIQLMAAGENNTTWGNVTNANFQALEELIIGTSSVTFASNNQTVSLTDANSTQTARHMRLNCGGTTGGSTRTLTVPATEKLYIVYNGCADSITVTNGSGTTTSVPAGKTMWVYNDGTNVVDVVTHLTSLTLGTVLAVTSGGTGSNTAAGARTSLSAAASGANSDITSLSGLTTPLSVAQGGTAANTAAGARTSLGVAASGSNSDITALTYSSGIQIGSPTGGAKGSGTINATGLYVNNVAVGGGSVTSVDASGGSTGLTFSGGPITSSGTLTMAGTLAVAYGGTGSTTASAARTALGAAASGANTDITALDQDITITATGTIAANTIGFRGLPQNAQTSGYTLVLADAGKHISITTGGVTVPANGSTAFPIGTGIVIYNDSGGSQNIGITTDTMRLAGSSSTGTRALAGYGLASLVKVASTTWVISGTGVT
jgi:hypothetical protein